MSLKPIILDDDGIFSQLPDGSIINAGGTSNLTWTVGGRGLLFDDGTSTGGGGGLAITLQNAYNNSTATNGQVTIKLAAGRDLAILDSASDDIFFKVDAETGKVTITGDLEILGNSTVIDTVVQNIDHWQISPKSGITPALKIEPDLGVNPIVDLVTVRCVFGGTPVFKIDAMGNLVATQDLTVGGLINGVDLPLLKTAVDSHLAGLAGWRHMAAAIDIAPIASLPTATNVQQALEQINSKADSGGGGGGGGSLTLQSAYENTLPSAPASIVLVSGRNFSVRGTDPASGHLAVDAATGNTTVTGDLSVKLKNPSGPVDWVVDVTQNGPRPRVAVNAQLLLSSPDSTKPALIIAPPALAGNLANHVTVMDVWTGSGPFINAFKIDVDGHVLINGRDILQEFDAHLAAQPGHRHTAADVDVAPIISIPSATNVQQAIEQINQKVDAISGSGSSFRGYEHVQSTASLLWTLNHNLASKKAQISIYDSDGIQIIPEQVQLTSMNTALVSFASPITGTATIIAF